MRSSSSKGVAAVMQQQGVHNNNSSSSSSNCDDRNVGEPLPLPPHIRRWNKREGELVGSLYEALLRWPLFLHLVLMLSLLWIAGYHQYNYPFAIIVAIFYLHKVDNVQKERLKIQMQNRMEEKRSKRVRITDTESVMWLNFLLQEMWPCWLERWLSKLVGECLHVNLSHYKPRALNKLVIDFLRLGSSPPVIQSVRVHRVSEDGDNAVMEMDVSFVAADDMRVELIAKLKRASVGLGLAGKLYGNNLRIEGKLRLGCKFVPYYPYLGQLTVAFVTVPILGLSVRPLSSSSVDVTDLPGIASWVTKAVQTAVETCLVEPYPLRLDLIKLCGACYDMDTDKDGIHFRHTGTLKDSKDVGFAILEILDGKNLEPKDRCGLPDPYVKITVDKMKFKTSIKKQTLHPVWHELFRICICSWNLPSKILLRARDRDSFGKDDELGWCAIDLHTVRGGMRKDMWLSLQGAKTGHLHIALTVVEHNFKSGDSPMQEEERAAISVSNDATDTTPADMDDALRELLVVPHGSRGQASSEEDLQEQLLLLQSPLGMGASTNSAVQPISSSSVLEKPEETNSESKKKSRKQQLKNHRGSGFKFLRQRALSRCIFDNSKPDEREKDQPRSILLLSSADHHQKCPKARLSPVKRGGTLKALYKRLTIDTHNTSSAPNNLDAAASPDGSTKESLNNNSNICLDASSNGYPTFYSSQE